MFLSIPTAEKKYTQTVSDVYFLLRVRIIFRDVFLFIANIGKFSFVRKKRRTKRQTDKQHFTLDCKAKMGLL